MRNLTPNNLWNYFYSITQIPRPSGKETQISLFLENFARNKNLFFTKDEAGNVLIRKDASPGFEQQRVVILQAHMDMVCEKNAEVKFDFEHDSIQTYLDGDWVKAKGTTLGADNGIGMALILAVLSDEKLQHPALECLFTSDEETGLTGASALSRNLLTGSTLINLDSEDDGEIYVGCAGGMGTKALLNYAPGELPEGYFGFKVEVSGLNGGHSGGDIHLGLGNAVKILGNYLFLLSKQMNVRLAGFEGGNLHNAIPREASALVAVPYHEKETIRVLLNIYLSEIENIYKDIEPGLKMDLQSETITGSIIEKNVSDNFINLLTACPHGVIAMSKDIPGLVETSTNLASVKMKDNRLEVNTSQRSSSKQAISELANQMYALFALAGAEVIQSEGYPGWKPNLNSAILKIAEHSYQTLFGEEAKVKAVHAGLECGLFLEKYPNLDMISIGPQMYGVHSPDERLSVSSTQKTWEWLIHILGSKN